MPGQVPAAARRCIFHEEGLEWETLPSASPLQHILRGLLFSCVNYQAPVCWGFVRRGTHNLPARILSCKLQHGVGQTRTSLCTQWQGQCADTTEISCATMISDLIDATRVSRSHLQNSSSPTKTGRRKEGDTPW